jgi:hypothetical protein
VTTKTVSEHTLVADLMADLACFPGFVSEKHADRFNYGSPDICVTGLGLTTRWEAKYADPDFEWKGIQHLTCRRLAKYGYCRYIIWRQETGLVHICHPDNLIRWQLESETVLEPLMTSVAGHIIRVHYDYARQQAVQSHRGARPSEGEAGAHRGSQKA